MEFDEDEIVVSDGFNSDGKCDDSEEENMNTLTDREKQEIYFQRRKHKKEAQERLELAANHKSVGISEPGDEIDEVHQEITANLLSLVVSPEKLADLFSSPFLSKLVRKSLFYLPEHNKIVIGNGIVFRPESPYSFNGTLTTMYLETSSIPTKEFFKFTEIQGVLNFSDVTKAIATFVEEVLITNNIQPFLDSENLSKIIMEKKQVESGKFKVDKQVLLFRIKKAAYTVVEPNRLTVPQIKGIIKDLILVSDDELIKDDDELKEIIKAKIETLKEEANKIKTLVEERSRAEKSIHLERLKQKYSKKNMFDETGAKTNETKIKTIKEWLEHNSVNTSLSEKNMVKGIIQQIKEFKI
eukprot:GAHX01001292.1.p1 GENE.GAHX01001292.1~~GAHX01001292.1.p1  ORF type:complete len:355 (+),score=96.44 GAHX01001292.1:29-1093(+)